VATADSFDDRVWTVCAAGFSLEDGSRLTLTWPAVKVPHDPRPEPKTP